MHFGMGVVSLCRRLLSPSTSSWNLGTHFSAGPLHFVDLSPLEATPPSTHPAEFHVCPHPQGTLSKFTLGQVSPKSWPSQRTACGRWGWTTGLGRGKRNPCKYLGKTRVSGKGISRLPIFPRQPPGIDSESEFLFCFSLGIAPPIQRFLLSCSKGHTQQ